MANTTSGQIGYASAVAAFRLEDVERLFQGSFANGMNVCSQRRRRWPYSMRRCWKTPSSMRSDNTGPAGVGNWQP